MRSLALAALLLFPSVGHAQYGLYSPQPVPRHTPAPMGLGGVMLDRDRVVEADTVMSQQIVPGPIADSLWSELESCTQRPVAFGPMPIQTPGGWLHQSMKQRAEWTYVVVPGDAFFIHGEGPNIGFTAVEHHVILISEKYWGHRQLLKHEMLHALLYDTGKVTAAPWHPSEWFNPCGVQGQ